MIIIDNSKLERKIISCKEMSIGDTMIISSESHHKDKLLLKTYSNFVLLNDPKQTWTYDNMGFSGYLVDIIINVKGQ